MMGLDVVVVVGVVVIVLVGGLVNAWLLHHFALLLEVSLSLIEALGVGVDPGDDGPVLLKVPMLVHCGNGQRFVHE